MHDRPTAGEQVHRSAGERGGATDAAAATGEGFVLDAALEATDAPRRAPAFHEVDVRPGGSESLPVSQTPCHRDEVTAECVRVDLDHQVRIAGVDPRATRGRGVAGEFDPVGSGTRAVDLQFHLGAGHGTGGAHARADDLVFGVDRDLVGGPAQLHRAQGDATAAVQAQPRASADISREGVQRELLPLVEGSTVQTKYGAVRTDHVLFIAAGAFHVSKPSDLIPELQGRFPIRVELESLKQADLERILREPENSLPKQYEALLDTEGCHLEFTDDGLAEIARVAHQVNERQENIGARRLHTIMSTLLETMLFELPPDGEGPPPPTRVVVDREFVAQRLRDVVADEDLSRYIL